jgi:hypothetical protein
LAKPAFIKLLAEVGQWHCSFFILPAAAFELGACRTRNMQMSNNTLAEALNYKAEVHLLQVAIGRPLWLGGHSAVITGAEIKADRVLSLTGPAGCNNDIRSKRYVVHENSQTSFRLELPCIRPIANHNV